MRSPLTRAFWTGDRCIGAALVILPFLIFWKQALGITAFFHVDLQFYFYPYRKLVADTILSGHLPLWNPYTCGGMPLLGDGQTGVFYPPDWLFLLLRPEHALSMVVLSTYSIAGLGMFLFLRALGLECTLAGLIGLAFMFGQYFVAHLVHVSIPATAAWVPWIMWALERYLQQKSAGRFIGAASCIALQAFAGHPHVPVYTACAAGIYVLTVCAGEFLQNRRLACWTPLLSLFAMYGTGYALAAIQLVPWIELGQYSPRAAWGTFEAFTGGSITGTNWLMFLFPYMLGGLQKSWMQSDPHLDIARAIVIWERAPYVGLAILALVPAGVVELVSQIRDRAQGSRLLAIAIMTMLALLIAAGTSTPFINLVYHTPVLGKLRGPGRAMAIGAFGLCVMAAFGLSRVWRAQRRFDVPVAFGGLSVLAAVATAPCLWTSEAQLLNTRVPLLLAIATAAAFLWLAFGGNRINRALLAAILGVDLIGLACTFNPVIPAEQFRNTPALVDFLRRDTDLYRVAAFTDKDSVPVYPSDGQRQLAMSWSIPFQIEDINGFNSLQMRRMVDLLYTTKMEDITYGFLHEWLLVPPYSNRLTQMGVRYAVLQKSKTWNVQNGWQPVYEDEQVRVLKNPADSSRAVFAELVIAKPEPSEVLKTVCSGDFNAAHYAVVEGMMSPEDADMLSSRSPATVTTRRVSNNEMRFDTRTTQPRLLVVRERYFPGWKAEYRRSGGADAWQQLKILPVNYLHRGVIVPAGDNEVRMVYRPGSVGVGALISIAAVVGSCAALVVERRARGRN